MSKRRSEAFFTGIILLVIGSFLLLQNLDLLILAVSYNWMITIALITLGVLAAVNRKSTLKIVGLFALILGGIYLLDLMGVVHFPQAWKLKDCLFILLGLFLIL